MESRRKSGRAKHPSKKYSIDPFEGLDIPDDLTDGPASSAPDLEADDEDADFQVDINPSPEVIEEDISEDEATKHNNLPDAGDNADEESDPDGSVVDASDVDNPITPSGQIKGRSGNGVRASLRSQPRGLLEPQYRGPKDMQRMFQFGPAPEDQNPALQAYFKWRDEPSVPSTRPSLSGLGGFKRSYYQTDDAFQRDANEGWDWYEVEGGKEAFRDRQISSNLPREEGKSYLPSSHNSHSFVMGPYKRQKLFHLPVGNSVDLNDAWKSEPTSPEAEQVPLDSRIARHGWTLNTGEGVQCLDWVPHQGGPRQFLAVSCLALLDVEGANFKAPSAPAFTPQSPRNASIQIWEFAVNKQGDPSADQQPQLRHVICTPWGDIKSFKWCPMPRSQASFSKRDGQLNLGLLGGVWGDGVARVLDISIPDAQADVQYTLMTSAAFSTRPPNTVCTCLTWLSSNSIVVGCANGCIGVWNLPASLNAHKPAQTPTQPQFEPSNNAEPLIYFPISSTYILSIITCYPSHANLLVASTMAGYIHLTDLHDLRGSSSFSSPATVKSNRSRLGRSPLAWHDHSQMVFTADDNYALVALPLRRIWRTYSFTRYKSPAQIIAVSPIHPFIMAGGVGGDVTCNNPLRRALDNKAPIWNQIWFSHEWRALRADEKQNGIQPLNNTTNGDTEADTAMPDAAPVDPSSAEEQSQHPPRTTRPGISRILESLKAEQVKVFNAHDSFSNKENGAVYSTVYDIETSVRAVCWNPNIHVGGWVAAGMGSGLLRVEDVAA